MLRRLWVVGVLVGLCAGGLSARPVGAVGVPDLEVLPISVLWPGVPRATQTFKVAYAVRNRGTAQAPAPVTFTITPPAGMTVLAVGSIRPCTPAGSDPVVCQLGALAPNGVLQVVLTVTTNTPGVYPTSAAVSAALGEVNLANNSSSRGVLVNP